MDARKVGRPSDYTKNMADLICEDISTGKSLRSVCREDNRPSIATIFKWMRDNPEFLKQYEQATQERADVQHEELTELGDEALNYARTDTDSRNVPAVMQAYRLKFDSLKWSASKMKPKKYGDSVDMTSGGNPISIRFDNSFEKEQ